MKDVEKQIDELIHEGKQRDYEKRKEKQAREEQKKASEREEQYRINNMYINIAERVTDARPEKDAEKMKRKERELLDAIIDSFKAGYRDGFKDAYDEQKRPDENMVMDNLIHAIPKMSNEQLKYHYKTYEDKKNKIVDEKLKKNVKPTPEEVKVLEVYRAVEKEIERRRQVEMSIQHSDGEIKDKDKKNGKKGR